MSPFQAYPVAFTLLLSRGAPTRSRGSSETKIDIAAEGGPGGEFADDESACLAILAVDEGPDASSKTVGLDRRAGLCWT